VGKLQVILGMICLKYRINRWTYWDFVITVKYGSEFRDRGSDVDIIPLKNDISTWSLFSM